MTSISELPRHLLTVHQVAAITNLSVSTLNKRRLTNSGPKFVRLGRAVRYDPIDIADYVARNKFQNTSQYGSHIQAPDGGSQ